MASTKLADKPSFLYRYRSDDTSYVNDELAKAIESRCVWFSPIQGQNDPLDSNPIINESTEAELLEFYEARGQKYLVGKDFLEGSMPSELSKAERDALHGGFEVSPKSIRKFILESGILRGFRENFGICCFSSVNGSQLMWSHYANSHRGYCLKYRYKDGPLERDDRVPLSVEYSSKRPKLSYIDILTYMEDSRAGFARKSSAVSDALFYSKSDAWSYEQEWRASVVSDKPGYYSIKCLEPIELILGCRSEMDPRALHEKFGKTVIISQVELISEGYALERKVLFPRVS